MGYPEAQYVIDEVVDTIVPEIQRNGGEMADLLNSSIIEHGVKTFTANGTFTVPAGVTKILVTACAGGGGGGSYDAYKSTYNCGGGGGGGSVIVRRAFTVRPLQNLNITVGKGGIARTPENSGATIVGDLITLAGGMTGTNASMYSSSSSSGNGGDGGMGAGGGGGGNSNSDDSYDYGSGGKGYFDGKAGKDGCCGGSSIVANGGKSLGTGGSGGGGGASLGNGGDSLNSATWVGPGHGGGGAGGNGYHTSGGDGGNGIVIIEW